MQEMNNFDDLDINEKDFEYIEENLSKLDKARIKRKLNKSIKNQTEKNKKFKYTTVAAVLLITIGATSVPTVAKNIPFISYIYEKVGFDKEYSKYTDCIGKTIEHNGMKVTIENIVGTKYKALVTAKLEAETEEAKVLLDKVLITCNFQDSTTGYSAYSSAMTKSRGDNGELLVLAESNNLISNIDKGDLDITVDFSDGNCEVLKYKADFSETSQSVEKVDINKEVDKLGIKAVSLESNIINTNLLVNGNLDNIENKVLIKVGEYIYPSTGGYIRSEGALEFSKQVSKKMDEGLNVSILPIISNINKEDLIKFDCENRERFNKENMNGYLKENNIYYNKELKFQDGTKGEIKKIEFVDNKVKVYYSASTEKHSIIMGTNMILRDIDMNKNKATGSFFPVVYKYYNQKGMYIAEFDKVSTSSDLELDINAITKGIDNIEIGESINIK